MRDLYPRPEADAWDLPVAGDYIEDLPEHLLAPHSGVQYHQQEEVPVDQLGLAGTVWLAKTNFEEEGNDPLWGQEEIMTRPRRQSCKIQAVNNVQVNSVRCCRPIST